MESYKIKRQISDIKGIGKTITLVHNDDLSDPDFEREDEDESSEHAVDLVDHDLGSKRKFSSSHGSARRGNVGVKPMFLNVQSGSEEDSDE